YRAGVARRGRRRPPTRAIGRPSRWAARPCAGLHCAQCQSFGDELQQVAAQRIGDAARPAASVVPNAARARGWFEHRDCHLAGYRHRRWRLVMTTRTSAPAGLQAQRTQLAWARTSLSFGAATALLARTDFDVVLRAVVLVFAFAGTVAVWLAGRARQREFAANSVPRAAAM